jgi:diaminohydroxyphosphoribosylaminopyrimidine deaminase/5-amino-6-(5-phosphoribosylamino)uracil reductase
MSEPFNDQDYDYMRRVLSLAACGAATTQPNPRVGCVLVNEGQIVGEGFHSKAGELHAEREALRHAGDKARGATAYVNLEPCCHQGRTPPCTDGLIDAGVTRVIGAMSDPNPLVSGGGYEQLRMAGVEVLSGLLEPEARWFNRGFVTRMQKKRPWLHIKTAATLDGRTADVNGDSQWISCAAARQRVHELRAESSAVLTGIGTVLADDPQLNVRLKDVARQPLRVLLDTQLRVPLDARIIGDDDGLLIFTCAQDQDKIAALAELGAEVICQQGQQLDLNAVVEELAHWQCNEVLIEAGQTLSGSFLDAGLVDQMTLFYGASVLGDSARAMFATGDPLKFSERPQFLIRSAQVIGESVMVEATRPDSLNPVKA